MFLLVVYISLALGASFLCSVLEAVLLSVTPSYVAKIEEQNPKAGERLRHLKVDIDKPLAAILSLNTVAHTIGAAGAGAQAQVVFGQEWVSIMSAILTLLILIVSEIIPKSLGAKYWKQLSVPVSYVLPWLITLTYPLVLMSQWFQGLVGGGGHGQTLDREEFSALAQMLVKEGIFGDEESSVLINLLRFHSLQGRHIMTPRTVLVGFNESETVGDVVKDEDKLRFSRFPVWTESSDHVTGLVLKHDLMLALARGDSEVTLATLKREVSEIRDDAKVTRLLNHMLKSQEHFVVLKGEFGGTAGVVTLEDLVETLLGMEIVDEIDPVEDMQSLARKAWEERARARGVEVEGAAEAGDVAPAAPEGDGAKAADGAA